MTHRSVRWHLAVDSVDGASLRRMFPSLGTTTTHDDYVALEASSAAVPDLLRDTHVVRPHPPRSARIRVGRLTGGGQGESPSRASVSGKRPGERREASRCLVIRSRPVGGVGDATTPAAGRAQIATTGTVPRRAGGHGGGGPAAGCSSSSSDGEAGRGVLARGTTPRPLHRRARARGRSNWRSTEIVDGDTLYVSGPNGELEVRIVGVNTPESGECFDQEATDALAELVAGNDLVLVTDRSDVDQFGRALRYVDTTDGVDVGAELIANGFAIARRYPPDDARADRYAALQRDAKRRAVAVGVGRGAVRVPSMAWTSSSTSTRTHRATTAKNLNGEWVRFTNAGTEAIDLDGWEVADESASHRYPFTDLHLAPGAEVTLFSGCGPDDETARDWCVSGSAVWNNSGDTVFLRDGNGNIVATLSYGDSG